MARKLQTAVAERPDLPSAWVGLGELYIWQERWDEVEPGGPADGN
jgi:cytochrome c-type biogenesis protein CcmH/NrfG